MKTCEAVTERRAFWFQRGVRGLVCADYHKHFASAPALLAAVLDILAAASGFRAERFVTVTVQGRLSRTFAAGDDLDAIDEACGELWAAAAPVVLQA